MNVEEMFEVLSKLDTADTICEDNFYTIIATHYIAFPRMYGRTSLKRAVDEYMVATGGGE